MGHIVGERKELWYWLPSCANIAAPTTAEFAAGLRISPNLLEATGFAPETASIATSGIEDDFDIGVPGRRSFQNMRMRFKRQPGTDTVYNTLGPDQGGFLSRRRSISIDTAITAAQKVEVYPVTVGEPSVVDFEPNMIERFDVPFFPAARPNLRATVA